MALYQCEECGNLFRPDVDMCPNCETPVKKEKSRAGYLGIIGIILFVGLLSIQFNAFYEKKAKEKDRLVKEEAIVLEQEQEGQEEANHIMTMEQDYQKLLSLYQEGDFDNASDELNSFKKYNEPEYEDISDIKKGIEIHKLEQQVKGIPAAKASENLALYKKLLSLEPDNVKYKKKVIYYKKKVDRQRRKKQRVKLTGQKKNQTGKTEKKEPGQKNGTMEIFEIVEEAPF